MNLELVALGLGSLGTIGTIISFFAFYKVNNREKKAKARLIERQGDAESLDYFREKILLLEEDVRKLQEKVRNLEQGKQTAEQELELYREAGKKCHECEGHTEVKPCPAITEYHRLKNK